MAATQSAITAAEDADTLAAAAAAAADRALNQAAGSDLSRGVWALVRGAADRLEAQQQVLDLWGVGADQLRHMVAADRAVLAERLRGNRMSEFADLIGRFRAFARAEAAQKIVGGHGELAGTTLGSDIARAIPSEIAALGVPALRPAFLARLAEGRLLSYETRGKAHLGRGPLIICLDASPSMWDTVAGDRAAQGSATDPTREAWAKAVTLALLDHAASAVPPREVTVVRFSVGIDSTHRFPADHPPAPD